MLFKGLEKTSFQFFGNLFKLMLVSYTKMEGNGRVYLEMSDSALMETLQAGDRNALAELYIRYFDPLKGFLITHFNGSLENQIEEIAQETFIKVLENADTYKGSAKFSSWLFSIAKNAAKDELRKNRIQNHLNDIAGYNQKNLSESIQGRDIIENLALQEMYGLVLEAINVLSEYHPECMEAVRLIDVGKLKRKEVAQLTGVPEPTLGSRLFHGRRYLREKLEPIYSIQQR